MYLLDTNVLSELRRTKPHGAVLAWLQDINDRDLHLSAVTFGEFQAGIELTREHDTTKAAEIEEWVDRVAANWKILPMDAATFRVWAKLMHRRSNVLLDDAMIAATALVHGLQVVTRNVRDFKEFGVGVVNPFTAN
jgi:predicted nucleic acid-binding protein